jgi:hypothetical protein
MNAPSHQQRLICARELFVPAENAVVRGILEWRLNGDCCAWVWCFYDCTELMNQSIAGNGVIPRPRLDRQNLPRTNTKPRLKILLPILRGTMRTLFRAIVGALSILTVTAAATSWSFSDATLAVGPKGKDATSSYSYSLIRALLNGQVHQELWHR